jgi:hypothetical protein
MPTAMKVRISALSLAEINENFSVDALCFFLPSLLFAGCREICIGCSAREILNDHAQSGYLARFAASRAMTAQRAF